MSRKLKNQIKKLDQWLIDQGIIKAKRTYNDYMLNLISGMNGQKCVEVGLLTNAQRELLNDYLEIPNGTMININEDLD